MTERLDPTRLAANVREVKPPTWIPMTLERRNQLRAVVDDDRFPMFMTLTDVKALLYEIGVTHERLDELDEIEMPLSELVPKLIDGELRPLLAELDRLTEALAERTRERDEALKAVGVSANYYNVITIHAVIEDLVDAGLFPRGAWLLVKAGLAGDLRKPEDAHRADAKE